MYFSLGELWVNATEFQYQENVHIHIEIFSLLSSDTIGKQNMGYWCYA